MKKRVTMAMIADKCGTSIGTVDRALNNRSEINPETKQLVLDTAVAMGYKTNPFASALSRRSTKRIALVYPSEPNEFYSCISAGIKKAAAEIAPYGVEIDIIPSDAHMPSSQLYTLQNLKIDKYDAIAVNPLSNACTPYIDSFTEQGKKVVLFNNDIPNSSRLFYVGGNSLQSGRIGGEIMGMILGGHGDVSVLGNFFQIMPFFERFDGFCQVVQEKYPAMNIYTSPDCRLDAELTKKNVVNLLQRVPDLKGIFCAGYTSTVDIIDALADLGRTDIILVGYDISSKTADAIRSGACKVLLYQDPFQQGYQTVTLLTKHLLNGWTPKQSSLYIDTRVVLSQNIDDYTGGIIQWDLSV